MRKAYFAWMLTGLILGAGSVTAYFQYGPGRAAVIGESQAAELEHLLGDPTPLGENTPGAEEPPEWLKGNIPGEPLPKTDVMVTDTPLPTLATQSYTITAKVSPNETFDTPAPDPEPIAAPKIQIPIEPRPMSTSSFATGADTALTGLPLTGTHQVNLDENNNLIVPAGVLNQLNSPNILFVGPGPDHCLEVYTLADLEQWQKKRNASREEVRRWRRLWFSRLTTLHVAEGKITLPAHLVQAAKIQKQAVVIGVCNHFEIWDAGRWHSYADVQAGSPFDVSPKVMDVTPVDWRHGSDFAGQQ